MKDWSGSCAPEDPANWWVDDETGEYVDAVTGERYTPEAGRAEITRREANRESGKQGG